MEYFTLSNGVEMPAVGIGTFLMQPDQAEQAVLTALQMGYKMIDTANAYMNERAVGRAMRKSGIAREDIFLSTKIWASEYEKENAVEKTLEILGDFAFGHSFMRSLRLPENAAWEYARQFKEGEIGTLYLSQKYRDVSNPSKLSYENSTGHLHSLCVNNVRIGEIVWLE